jgi:hypothetical protein
MPARPIHWILAAILLSTAPAIAAPPTKLIACKSVILEGELNAGQPYTQAIGGGLKVYFQPIHSGWILRVVPVSAGLADHDYAELATPPYNSVTPLSISTDFAFRAQDAIGWNPRRFRFATSAAAYNRLYTLYGYYEQAAAMPDSPARQQVLAKFEVPLSAEVAKATEATLTILDSRLIPGTADQWRMAAAVASHFETTAHSLVQPAPGEISALGHILWLRFRLQFDVPPGFPVNTALKSLPRPCNAP